MAVPDYCWAGCRRIRVPPRSPRRAGHPCRRNSLAGSPLRRLYPGRGSSKARRRDHLAVSRRLAANASKLLRRHGLPRPWLSTPAGGMLVWWLVRRSAARTRRRYGAASRSLVISAAVVARCTSWSASPKVTGRRSRPGPWNGAFPSRGCHSRRQRRRRQRRLSPYAGPEWRAVARASSRPGPGP